MIVDPDTSVILPPNSIGELWVASNDLYPEYYWSLPVHTEKYLRANPIYLSLKNESENLGVEVNVQEMVQNGKVLYKHTLEMNFIRTGLICFTLDSHSDPKDEDPLLYVLGKKQDIIIQKSNGNIPENPQILKQIFFSNFVSRLFRKLAPNLNAW